MFRHLHKRIRQSPVFSTQNIYKNITGFFLDHRFCRNPTRSACIKRILYSQHRTWFEGMHTFGISLRQHGLTPMFVCGWLVLDRTTKQMPNFFSENHIDVSYIYVIFLFFTKSGRMADYPCEPVKNRLRLSREFLSLAFRIRPTYDTKKEIIYYDEQIDEHT